MCPVKGGAPQKTVMDSVKVKMAEGMTVYQAIVEVENILRGKLPEHIKAIIYEELKEIKPDARTRKELADHNSMKFSRIGVKHGKETTMS